MARIVEGRPQNLVSRICFGPSVEKQSRAVDASNADRPVQRRSLVVVARIHICSRAEQHRRKVGACICTRPVERSPAPLVALIRIPSRLQKSPQDRRVLDARIVTSTHGGALRPHRDKSHAVHTVPFFSHSRKEKTEDDQIATLQELPRSPFASTAKETHAAAVARRCGDMEPKAADAEEFEVASEGLPPPPLDPRDFEERASYEQALFVRERADEASAYAHRLLQGNKHSQAAKAYERILSFEGLQPHERAVLYYQLATVRVKQWRWQDALAISDHVLHIEPHHAQALYRKAQAWHGLKDFDAALTEISRGREALRLPSDVGDLEAPAVAGLEAPAVAGSEAPAVASSEAAAVAGSEAAGAADSVRPRAMSTAKSTAKSTTRGAMTKFDELELAVRDSATKAAAAATQREADLRVGGFVGGHGYMRIPQPPGGSPRREANPVRLASLASPRFIRQSAEEMAEATATSDSGTLGPILSVGRSDMRRSCDQLESLSWVSDGSSLPPCSPRRSTRGTPYGYRLGASPQSLSSGGARQDLPMIHPWLPEPLQPSGSRRLLLQGSAAVDRWWLHQSKQRDARAIATTTSYLNTRKPNPGHAAGRKLILHNAKRAMQQAHRQELIDLDNRIMENNILLSVGSLPPPNLKALEVGARQMANALQVRRRREFYIRKENARVQRNMERQPGVVSSRFPLHDHWLGHVAEQPVVLGKASGPPTEQPRWDPGHIDYKRPAEARMEAKTSQQTKASQEASSKQEAKPRMGAMRERAAGGPQRKKVVAAAAPTTVPPKVETGAIEGTPKQSVAEEEPKEDGDGGDSGPSHTVAAGTSEEMLSAAEAEDAEPVGGGDVGGDNENDGE